MIPKLTYKIIIKNAKNREKTNPLKNNFEVHHIKPKCLGGSDNKRNLVKLTLREHYFCHYLLFRIYQNNKLALAYYLMSNSEKYGKILSSRQYEKAKILAHSLSSETVDLANRGRCLRYMWRYLCKLKINKPSKKVILAGWKSPRGYVHTTWKKFFKKDEWILEVRKYIEKHPIDINYNFKRHNTEESIKNQFKSMLINTFIKKLKDKSFWYNKKPNTDGKYVITKTFIANSKYYYPKGRCWKTIKWKKYYSKKDWIYSIIDAIKNLKFDYITYKF